MKRVVLPSGPLRAGSAARQRDTVRPSDVDTAEKVAVHVERIWRHIEERERATVVVFGDYPMTISEPLTLAHGLRGTVTWRVERWRPSTPGTALNVEELSQRPGVLELDANAGGVGDIIVERRDG